MFSLKICSILMLVLSTSAALSCNFYTQRITNSGLHSGSVNITCTTGADASVEIHTNSLPEYQTNAINSATTHTFTILRSQNSQSKNTGCVPQGAIGISKQGVLIYNALDADDKNAVESEFRSFDSCSGHGKPYHYHTINAASGCSFGDLYTKKHALVGVSLDGYAIRGPFTGTLNLTRDDLDECGGYMIGDRYNYIVTPDEFPYFFGCFNNTDALTGKVKEAVLRRECETQSSRLLCSCKLGVISDPSTKRSVIPAVQDTRGVKKAVLSDLKEKRKLESKDASNLLKLLLEELETEG